jgi:hypothetical protein
MSKVIYKLKVLLRKVYDISEPPPVSFDTVQA